MPEPAPERPTTPEVPISLQSKDSIARSPEGVLLEERRSVHWLAAGAVPIGLLGLTGVALLVEAGEPAAGLYALCGFVACGYALWRAARSNPRITRYRVDNRFLKIERTWAWRPETQVIPLADIVDLTFQPAHNRLVLTLPDATLELGRKSAPDELERLGHAIRAAMVKPPSLGAEDEVPPDLERLLGARQPTRSSEG